MNYNLSGDRCGDVQYKSVSDAQLHFTFTVTNVSDALDLVYKLVIGLSHADSNPIEVLLIDVARSHGCQNSFTDGAVDSCVLQVFHCENGRGLPRGQVE